MKLTWIAKLDPRFPSDGACLYTRGLLAGVAANGARVNVFGYARSRTPAVDGTVAGNLHLVVAPSRWRPLSLLSTLQSDAWRLQSADLRRAILADITADTDAVVFDYFATGWLLPSVRKHVLALGAPRPLLIHVTHNHEASLRRMVAQGHGGIFGLALRYDALKAARMERALVDAADIVTVNTDEDRQLFEGQVPDKRYLTLTPAYDGEPNLGPDIGSHTPRRVVMMGSLEWVAKRESLRRFVAAADGAFRQSGIELSIIGKADATFRREIEGASSVCNFLGFVDDPTPVLRAARIGLMPDELGGGFKHRFLHYIFRGVPVAAIGSQTAGMPFVPETGMVTGEDVQGLVRAIVAAMDDIPRLNSLRRHAFERCKGQFEWPERGKRLLGAIEQQEALRKMA